jgi:hypothetical protein
MAASAAASELKSDRLANPCGALGCRLHRFLVLLRAQIMAAWLHNGRTCRGHFLEKISEFDSTGNRLAASGEVRADCMLGQSPHRVRGFRSCPWKALDRKRSHLYLS